MLTTDDFRTEVLAQLRRGETRGAPSLEINAGEIHRKLGGYPGAGHRMPMCCEAMRGLMKAGDMVVSEPPSGRGASLTIRYRLPR